MHRRYIHIRQVAASVSGRQKLSAELPKFAAITDGTDFADDVVMRFALKQGLTADLLAKIQEMSAGRITPGIRPMMNIPQAKATPELPALMKASASP